MLNIFNHDTNLWFIAISRFSFALKQCARVCYVAFAYIITHFQLHRKLTRNSLTISARSTKCVKTCWIILYKNHIEQLKIHKTSQLILHYASEFMLKIYWTALGFKWTFMAVMFAFGKHWKQSILKYCCILMIFLSLLVPPFKSKGSRNCYCCMDFVSLTSDSAPFSFTMRFMADSARAERHIFPKICQIKRHSRVC